eukprot:1137474-Pelagomonas_calceolata.AAC.8
MPSPSPFKPFPCDAGGAHECSLQGSSNVPSARHACSLNFLGCHSFGGQGAQAVHAAPLGNLLLDTITCRGGDGGDADASAGGWRLRHHPCKWLG